MSGYKINEAGDAVNEEEDTQYGELSYRVVPARPPLRIRDMRFELALQGESPSFDFGDYDNLGEVRFIARNERGDIIALDLDEFFPKPDFAEDPGHQRLVEYGEVAGDEFFESDVRDFIDSTGKLTISGFSFECPAVATATDCANFPLEKLRVWATDHAGGWDGVTRVADLLRTDTLPADVWTRCQPALKEQLQRHAARHAVRDLRVYLGKQLRELRTIASENDVATQSVIKTLEALVYGGPPFVSTIGEPGYSGKYARSE